MPHLTPLFTLTTHGLATICAGELAAFPGVTIREVGYRRVAATCSASLTPLLTLRTADDLFVDLASWPGVGRARSALARLRHVAAALDLHGALALCRRLRPIASPPGFSVTASFVGRRNYTVDEIKAAIADGISSRHRWPYRADDGVSDLNIRLFIDHEVAHIGMRLAARPLHERAYRRFHRPGALKPPIAAALLMLAGVAPGMRLLDPCCGSGTIAIEAALRGASAMGGDCDPGAIDAARANAALAGAAVAFRCMDARYLPLANHSFDRIVSNPPWGHQLQVGGSLAAFYRQLGNELTRLLQDDGRLVLLTDVPQLVRLPDLRCERQLQVSLHGLRPTILIYAS